MCLVILGVIVKMIFFFGSYQLNKEDTNSLTTLLSKSARSCGWKPKEAPKEQKSSKKYGDKYAVTTKKLLNQAEAVAASGSLFLQA
jgi:hypothetical protein